MAMPRCSEHRFSNLVATRNNLVHAKPGTASDGSQGVFRHGDPCAIAELERAADAFTECGMRLGEVLDGISDSPGGSG